MAGADMDIIQVHFRDMEEELLQRNDCLSRIPVLVLTRIEHQDKSDILMTVDSTSTCEDEGNGGECSNLNQRYPCRTRQRTKKSVHLVTSRGEDESEDSDATGEKEDDEDYDEPRHYPKEKRSQERRRSRVSSCTTIATPMPRGTKPERTCADCGEVFPSLAKLSRHVPVHQNATPYVCGVCRTAFRDIPALVEHKTTQHKRKRKPTAAEILARTIPWTPADHICHYCGKKWDTALELNSHKQIHINAPVSKCEVCHLVLKNVTTLRHHFQVVHLGFKHGGSARKMQKRLAETSELPPEEKKAPFVTCDLCGKLFWWEWKLEAHKWRTHGIGDRDRITPRGKPFVCEECGLYYKSKSALLTHLKCKKHSKDKTYMCESCGKGFRKPDGLRKHIARKHPEVPLPRRYEYGSSAVDEAVNHSIFDDLFLEETAAMEETQVPSGSDPLLPLSETFVATELQNTLAEMPAVKQEPEVEVDTKPLLHVSAVAAVQNSPPGDEPKSPPSPPSADDDEENGNDSDWETKYDPETLKRLRRACKRRASMRIQMSNYSNCDDEYHGPMPLTVKIEEGDESQWRESRDEGREDEAPRNTKAAKRKKRRPYQMDSEHKKSPGRSPNKKKRKPEVGIKCRLGGCRFRALDREQLASHRVEIHGRVDPVRTYEFKCDVTECTFRARYAESLESHRLTHNPKKWGSENQTTTSHKELHSAASAPLPTPAKVKVKGTHPYLCTHAGCTKGFSHRLRLVAHVQHVHLRIPRAQAATPKARPTPAASGGSVPDGGEGYFNTRKCRLQGCKFVAHARSELEEHRLQVHGSAWAKAFKRPRKRPINKHWIYCGIDSCTFRALLPETLANHQAKQHANTSPTTKFACAQCEKVFASNYYRQVHAKLKHSGGPSNAPRLPCKFCPRDFSCRFSLFGHLQRAHPSAPTFPCTFCSKNFYDQDETTIHEERHRRRSENPGLRYKCVVQGCQEVCTSQEDLQSHVKAVHDVPIDARTICPICGKECLACNFQAHQRTHTQQRKQCPYCPKGYFKHMLLERHKESAHPELFDGKEKGFICDLCGKSFHLKTSFTLHSSIHRRRNTRRPEKPRIRKPRKPRQPGPGEVVKRRRKRRTREEMEESKESGSAERRLPSGAQTQRSTSTNNVIPSSPPPQHPPPNRHHSYSQAFYFQHQHLQYTQNEAEPIPSLSYFQNTQMGYNNQDMRYM